MKPSNPVFKNKKAYHDYEILEELECGVVLLGTEVKSLRDGKGSIREGFCKILKKEVFLVNSHIPAYDKGGYVNHEPFRSRKLLLHRRQIEKLMKKVEQKGNTLIPLKMYFKKGLAKVLIGLGRGKKLYDKRESLKKKDAQRSMAREIKRGD